MITAPVIGDDLVAALAPLGFTEVEAQVYGALLATPGLTGYRLARSIGKGEASVYSALAGLERKTAVLGGAGSPRTFVAAPPSELIARLRTRQDQQFEKAVRMLERVAAPPQGGATAQLADLEQIYAKAEAMIDGARETLIWEMASAPIARLRPALTRASERGVRSAGLVLRPEDAAPGALSIVSPVGAKVATVWPVEVLIVIADAEQALVAGVGELRGEAIWSDNLFLSVVLHNAIASDLLAHRDATPDWGGPNRELFDGHPPGFRAFMEQAG